MNVEYRPWTVDDIERVRTVLRETWLATYSAFIPEDDILHYLEEHYNAESLRTHIRDPRIHGILAAVDGHAAGFVRVLSDEQEHSVSVQQLYVLPAFQRAGIGRHLMMRAARHARTCGYDRIWLGVMVSNVSSVKWYKALGFQIVRQEPFTMGSTTVEHYIGFVPVTDIEFSSNTIG
jgi:ribosomal protein S18 acetylase RimI-like enzyme